MHDVAGNPRVTRTGGGLGVRVGRGELAGGNHGIVGLVGLVDAFTGAAGAAAVFGVKLVPINGGLQKEGRGWSRYPPVNDFGH